jgi:hypothetical protein
MFLTIANNVDCGNAGLNTSLEANFILDDGVPVPFRHGLPNRNVRDAFLYQQLAFSETGLEHRIHTLSITVASPGQPLFVGFDYAIYT